MTTARKRRDGRGLLGARITRHTQQGHRNTASGETNAANVCALKGGSCGVVLQGLSGGVDTSWWWIKSQREKRRKNQ